MCPYGALYRALLKTIFYCLNYSSNLILAAPTFMKTGLESTEQVVGFGDIVRTISKNEFQKSDDIWCEIDGTEDATSLEDFPVFSNEMIAATLQMRGQWASEKDELNMDSNSWRTTGPSDLRNEGGMLSGPAARLPLIFLIVDYN